MVRDLPKMYFNTTFCIWVEEASIVGKHLPVCMVTRKINKKAFSYNLAYKLPCLYDFKIYSEIEI